MENRTAARWALFFGVAAFCVASSTSLLVILYMIGHDRELAARDLAYSQALEQFRSRTESDIASVPGLRSDLAAIKNWVVAVYERADARGWNLPLLPKEVRDVHEEKAVQPPR